MGSRQAKAPCTSKASAGVCGNAAVWNVLWGGGGGGALLAEKVLVVSHQQFHCYDKTEGAGRQRGREGVKNLGGRLGVEQANQLGHQRAANSCTGPHGAPDGDGFTGGALARSCGALVLQKQMKRMLYANYAMTQSYLDGFKIRTELTVQQCKSRCMQL